MIVTPVQALPVGVQPADYPNALDRHVGRNARPNALHDQGSWCGYALPAEDDLRPGFVGPISTADGIEDLTLRVGLVPLVSERSSVALPVSRIHSWSLPGQLRQEVSGPGYRLESTLAFASADIAVVVTRVWRESGARLGLLEPSHAEFETHPVDGASGYLYLLSRPEVTTAGNLDTVRTTVECRYTRADGTPDRAIPAGSRDADAVEAATQRWHLRLRRLQGLLAPQWRTREGMQLATKLVETLYGNWRAPRGALQFDGLLPSSSSPDYDGFWAWDSWKHAAALAALDPPLAKAQVQAMFARQREDGMVPDVIYADSQADNWRNSKPPLAAWAVAAILAADSDRDFLAAIYPRLLAYHRWWWQARDHDRDGLAEYGSTDGSLIAARWESGMDNAERFARTTMRDNGAGQWSMDQASPDLNAYLVVDAMLLARFATQLGNKADARLLQSEASALARRVRNHLFDAASGLFADRRMDGAGFIGHPGPETWLPLWAGIATPSQARSVARHLADPGSFNTLVPFPSLSRADPAFDAERGYWRGPVWIDQAYFAVEGLERTGHRELARSTRDRLLRHAAGLGRDDPVYENYDPLSGRGLNAANFSWSAAHFLLLMQSTSPKRLWP